MNSPKLALIYPKLRAHGSSDFLEAFSRLLHQLRPTSQPLLHRPNLPQVRLLDELRLGRDVQDAVAIPVVSAAGDEVLGV